MTEPIDYRVAGPADAEAIALLHTDSWRRAYRGMFSDEFLDGDLITNRRTVWRERLELPKANQFVCLALAPDRTAGFICGYGAEDPVWGSFIDNMHVASTCRRRGIGAELMRRAAAWFASSDPECGIYLRVLEANHGARRFYESLGAANAETVEKEIHPGHWGRSCRYVWSSARDLADAVST